MTANTFPMKYDEFCQVNNLTIIEKEIILTHPGVTVNSHFQEAKWRNILEQVKNQPA